MKEHFCPAEKSIITYQDKCNWCGEQETLAQTQEPVAWAHYDTFNNLNSLTTARFKATLATKNTGACCIALYITPPQRTWVGLTDDEQQHTYEQWQNDGWGVFYNAIEAKLKQKNGFAEEKNG
jgi:hypothetical protein